MGTASSAAMDWYFKYKDPGGFYREKSTGKKQPEAREYKHGFLEKLAAE